MHDEQASVSELERDNDAVELGKNYKEEVLRASDLEQKLFENKSLLSNTEAALDWVGNEAIELKTTSEELQTSDSELSRDNDTVELG